MFQYSIYAFSMLNVGCILISDLVVADFFMHSLPGMILLYLTASFSHRRCFCMRQSGLLYVSIVFFYTFTYWRQGYRSLHINFITHVSIYLTKFQPKSIKYKTYHLIIEVSHRFVKLFHYKKNQLQYTVVKVNQRSRL